MGLRISLLAAALVAVAFGASQASAQFTGPSARKGADTVAKLIKSAADDQLVQLEGRILRQVGHEKYIFSDGTGEIRVEIDDHLFVSQIDDKKVVIIVGEVEKEFMESPEIDVSTLRLKGS